MVINWRAAVASIAVAGALAACGSQASSGSSATGTPIATAAPTTSATPAPSASPVVLAQTVGSNGTILVAASNMITVYTFASDSPGGVSACKGGCATVWPPLTVPAGTTPTGGSGVTGALATITRDDGSLQVTYKGLPLYFFHKDVKPGDTLGHYTGWNLVTP